MAAPIFSLRNVPMRVKTLLAIAFAVVVFHVVPYREVEYSTTIEYAFVVITEMLAGLIMGFMANVAYYILSFAGQIIDQEIGFSMVNQYDPITSSQVTITGNLYTYAVMLMVVITNMHHYLIRAITDSFTVIPVGSVVLDFNIYEVMKRFVVDYFVLGFRIVLPIFASLLVVNTILAILARVAPQMNRFTVKGVCRTGCFGVDVYADYRCGGFDFSGNDVHDQGNASVSRRNRQLGTTGAEGRSV